MIHENGEVACWDRDHAAFNTGYRQDGGFNGEGTAPREVGWGHAVQVSVGQQHACAVSEQGAVACWGHNEEGELGAAVVRTRYAAEPVEVAVTDAVEVQAGSVLTCARRRDGTASCWGAGIGHTPQAVVTP
jgi:alpha-tubulin suppressor-like RCC1 family protein